jgi:glutamate-ammonia-ligase adenylyltransferase
LRDLGLFAAGYLSSGDFDRLVLTIEQEASRQYFTHNAEANLHRILSSLFDKVHFLLESIKYPYYIEIIIKIAVYSNYLTDIIIRNPEYLSWILSPGTLSLKSDEKTMQSSLEKSLRNLKTLEAKVNLIRLIKRREILRIGVNDILGNYNLEETTLQLSILAKALNSALFSLCHQEVLKKYGISLKTSRYCLIALGKCGGNELNYSSDVDLILFFDKNSTLGARVKKEYYELLSEAAHMFIQLSTEKTSKGYIYRVDFRLRPDGRNSPLCRTLKDYLQYYESRGEDWERQMLIKMSFVGGNLRLYEQFSDYMRHFIYPSSFSVSPLSQIALMKANIEKNMGDKDNVKLFSGGIRDIEFSVQALQLLNGGRLPSIRTGNTLTAISELLGLNLLTGPEAVVLSLSYVFFRRIEHFLQLMNDTQTHDLPRDEESLNNLACFLGFKSHEHLKKKIEQTRKSVRQVFRSITGETPKSESYSIEEVNFTEPKKALSNYRYVRTGQGLLEQKMFDKQTIDSFLKIDKTLLDFLRKSASPDTTLDNFARVIKTRPLPSIWYHEFLDSPFFNSVLRICQSCQKAVDMISTDSALGDLILSRKVFSLESLNGATVKQARFILSIMFSLGIIDGIRLSRLLSDLLADCLKEACRQSGLKYNYFVAAMGSLGSFQMTFSSDVDLIFAAMDDGSSQTIQGDFQNFLLQIRHSLQPFEVDCRLRPEGKSSQLVWDIEKYSEYIDRRLQTWELQAFVKIRFIEGNRRLFDSLAGKIVQKVESLDNKRLRNDVLDMRKKIEKQLLSAPQALFHNFFDIKKSRGGLVDIEFLLQYILLSNPQLYRSCIGKDTKKILSAVINYSDKFLSLEALKKNYSFLRNLLLKNQILFNSASSVLPLDEAKRSLLAREMGFKNLSEFEAALLKVTKSNKSFFDKFFA